MTSENRTNPPTDKALSVIIIGAGLGGLSAGLALRKQGHKVTILEKSRFATETGAAIHIPPNCTILLQWLGLKPEDFSANLLHHIYRYDEHGNVKFHIEFTQDMRKHWIAEWYLAHRIDFHKALKTAAASADGDSEPIPLHTACKVIDVDVATGTVTLEDGRVFQGDVLLGADGVHSVTREQVCPGLKPTTAPKSCFRWLVPTSRLASTAETAGVVEQPGAMIEWEGASRRLLGYPCSSNQVMNLCAFLPTAEAGAIDEGWHSSGSKGDMLRAFAGFSPGVRALMAEADELKLKSWALMQIEPLPTWVRGRAALLGDAAHPFQPYMGQGAAMAIEDAVSVAVMLPLGTTPDQVPARLALYERARMDRVAKVQEYTRLNGQDSDHRRVSSAEMVKFMNDCFDHDERKSSARLLEATNDVGDGVEAMVDINASKPEEIQLSA